MAVLCVEGMLAVRVAGRWRSSESSGRLAWVRVAPSSWCQGGPATVTLAGVTTGCAGQGEQTLTVGQVQL